MHPKITRVYMPKIKVIGAVASAVLAIVLSVKVIRFGALVAENSGLTPLTIVRLLFDQGAPLRQLDSRTNVVILGIAGGEHAGADLTDTMMVLSFRYKDESFALISLPRDIWSDTLKDKINSAYHYGEEKKKGGGLVLAKAIIEDVLGLPMHYGIVVDFSGFQEVIDLVGGITVNVPQAFTDPEFPVPGKEDDLCDGDPTFRCRYENLYFDAGMQVMSGEQALKYVRSRLAVGEEGSDFARGRRQQEVLVALKQKLVSFGTWSSIGRLSAIFRAFEDATESDMNIGELATVGKVFAQVKEEKIQRISLEDELYAPPILWYGRYVLLPLESFEAIGEFVKDHLEKNSSEE